MLCQEDKKLTKKILTCWIRQARASGGHQLSLKDANFNGINLLEQPAGGERLFHLIMGEGGSGSFRWREPL
jgi:hypothetical protein